MRGTRVVSRIVGVGLLALFLTGVIAPLGASPAGAVPSHKSECLRLTRQISHFEDVASMAAERGDEMWFDGTVDHIKQLATRRVRLCPEYEEPNYAKIYTEWAMWMMRRAAEAFMAYTTFGAW